ncbi:MULTISPECIES: DUF6708 domain-containing protein [unclassified Pseudomonas]|uniref:DUF6708 domain-containing protein n=1 Tax=unclassified Pseudomonas TaxID=196821 RepID=UPI0037FF16DB
MILPHREFGWKYDLPAPDTPSNSDVSRDSLDAPSLQVGTHHIELSRSTLKFRGGWIIGGGAILLISTLLAAYIISSLFGSSPPSIKPTLVILASFCFLYFIFIPYIRMDFSHPCDEPIRFNRHRRKVYFYQYRYDRLHPLGRKNWGIKPVAYEWRDLTAEVYSIYAPMGFGGLVEKVVLAVRRPGTDEVIDRLLLSDNIEEGKNHWAIARLYMQKGPEALPELMTETTERNSNYCFNPFVRLAPKVQWPADMDLESRTAPAPGDQP